MMSSKEVMKQAFNLMSGTLKEEIKNNLPSTRTKFGTFFYQNLIIFIILSFNMIYGKDKKSVTLLS